MLNAAVPLQSITVLLLCSTLPHSSLLLLYSKLDTLRSSSPRYSSLLYSTLLPSSPFYSSLLFFTLLCSPHSPHRLSSSPLSSLLFSTVLSSSLLFSPLLSSSLLFSPLLSSTVLYSALLFSTLLSSPLPVSTQPTGHKTSELLLRCRTRQLDLRLVGNCYFISSATRSSLWNFIW